MSSTDYWLDTYCPACSRGDHGSCDPQRQDRPDRLCECWACLPNDHEIPIPTPREGT